MPRVISISSYHTSFIYSGITLLLTLSAGDKGDFTLFFNPVSSDGFYSKITIVTDKGTFIVALAEERNHASGF